MPGVQPPTGLPAPLFMAPLSVLRKRCDDLCHDVADDLGTTTDKVWEETVRQLRYGDSYLFNKDEAEGRPGMIDALLNSATELNLTETRILNQYAL